MLRVGLTGGIACGKSFVGRVLAAHGCHVLKADDLGRAVILPGGEAYHPVIEHFGRDILTPEGLIDRSRLASLVFGDPERLALLNSLIHPAVFRREEQFIDSAAAADPSAIIVVEAAILVETGSYRRYHKLIVVVCSEQQQIERAMGRDGSTREEVLARIRRQMPLDEKRKYADYIIDTSGTEESTEQQTTEVWRALRSINE